VCGFSRGGGGRTLGIFLDSAYHRCSPEVDHLALATMNGHARCPEETVPDLPTVVPARRESR
jgi:hypothetical protein